MCASPDGQEETSIFYDAKEKLLKVDTRRSGPHDTPGTVEEGPFELKDGERLKLRIFGDRSVVEVFANSRQAIARRIYLCAAGTVSACACFPAAVMPRCTRLRPGTFTPSNPY